MMDIFWRYVLRKAVVNVHGPGCTVVRRLVVRANGKPLVIASGKELELLAALSGDRSETVYIDL